MSQWSLPLTLLFFTFFSSFSPLHTHTHTQMLLYGEAAGGNRNVPLYWAVALLDVWGWECMIRGRKRLHRRGTGEHKLLSLSQEMSLSDLLQAAVQSCLPGESDPVLTVCAQCYIRTDCNVTINWFESHVKAKEKCTMQPCHIDKQTFLAT